MRHRDPSASNSGRRRAPEAARRAALALLAACTLCVGCGPSQSQIDQQRRDAEEHYNLGYGYFFGDGNTNADAALQATLRALEMQPVYPEAHMLAGLIHLGRENYLDAVDHFRQALEQKPDYRDAHHNLGAAYLASERWDEAIRVFETLTADRFYATPGNGHNNLGWAWYKKGDLSRARKHLERAIKLAPELCPAYNNLGLVLYEQGEVDDASRQLDRAVRRCPTYAEPYYHLGRVEARQANLSGARSRFSRCRELAGDAPLADRCAKRLAALPPEGSR